MEEKSEALRRELLTRLIQEHGAKGRKVLIMKAKEAGIYKNYVSDEEVFDLIKKFAAFHDLFIQDKIKVEIEEPKKPLKVEISEPVLTIKERQHRDEALKLKGYINEEILSQTDYIAPEEQIRIYKENPFLFLEALKKESQDLEFRLTAVNNLIKLYYI
jgi:hypothetical protein